MDERFEIKNLADIEAIENRPIDERFKEQSTYEMIKSGVELNPDGIALSFLLSGDTYVQPMQITYQDFLKRIHQCANLFYDLGIGPRDVVTFLLPNIPQTHYVIWGAEAAGIVNPINPLLEPATIKDICNAAKTKILVALGEFPGSDIWQKVEEIKDQIPTLQKVVRVMGPGDDTDNIIGFEDTLDRYTGDSLIFDRKIEPDDISSLYHTGGTTGTPKLAKRTHFNEVCMAWMIRSTGEMNAESTLMCGLPLFHVNATSITGLAPFSVGAHVVLLSPAGFREPSIIINFYKIVEHFKANIFSAVPTVLTALLDVPPGDNDISSLHYVISGTAPLSVEIIKRFEQQTGMRILEGYGLTEGACASAVNPLNGKSKPGSIGMRMPYQNMKTIIIDDQGNYLRDAETNEIGAVAIQGPNVFKGYVEDIHNKGIWVDGDWFNTGDLGRQDEDGYFWLTGRKKELIIRGGHNIDPAAIEEVLYMKPEVLVAAAIGRPDAYAGEVPVAFVQLKENSAITSRELMEFAREQVGEKAAVPKEIFIIDAIPVTPVGKIFKPALRWKLIAEVFKSELASFKNTAESFDVTVKEDKIHGSHAQITVINPTDSDHHAIEKNIKEKFAGYSIHYSVSIC